MVLKPVYRKEETGIRITYSIKNKISKLTNLNRKETKMMMINQSVANEERKISLQSTDLTIV